MEGTILCIPCLRHSTCCNSDPFLTLTSLFPLRVSASEISVTLDEYTVATSFSLAGVDLSSWTAAQQSALAAAIAAQLGVPASQVSVGAPTGGLASGGGGSGGRRRLAQAQIVAPVTVSALGRDPARAQAVAASVGTVAASPAVAAAAGATSIGVRFPPLLACLYGPIACRSTPFVSCRVQAPSSSRASFALFSDLEASHAFPSAAPPQVSAPASVGAKLSVAATFFRADFATEGARLVNSDPAAFSAAVSGGLVRSGIAGISVVRTEKIHGNVNSSVGMRAQIPMRAFSGRSTARVSTERRPLRALPQATTSAVLLLPPPQPVPPPSPPLVFPALPPAPPAVAQAFAVLRLAGYAPEDFGPTQRWQTIVGLASLLGVGRSSVLLGLPLPDTLQVSPPPPLPPQPPGTFSGRRSLRQAAGGPAMASMRVPVSILAQSQAEAAVQAAALNGAVADGSLLSALQSAGLSAARAAGFLAPAVAASPAPPPRPPVPPLVAPPQEPLLSTVEIVGIAIAGAVFCVLAVFAVVVALCRRHGGAQKRRVAVDASAQGKQMAVAAAHPAMAGAVASGAAAGGRTAPAAPQPTRAEALSAAAASAANAGASPGPLQWATLVSATRPDPATWGAHDALPSGSVVRTPMRGTMASPEDRYADAMSSRRRQAAAGYSPAAEDWLDVVARARDGVDRLQRMDDDLQRNLPAPPAARPGTRRFAIMQQYMVQPPQAAALDPVTQRRQQQQLQQWDTMDESASLPGETAAFGGTGAGMLPGSATRGEELLTYGTAHGGHASGTPGVTRSQALVAYDAWLQNESRRLQTVQERRRQGRAAAAAAATAATANAAGGGDGVAGPTPSTAGRVGPRAEGSPGWASNSSATPAVAESAPGERFLLETPHTQQQQQHPQGGQQQPPTPSYGGGTPHTPPNQRPNNW